MVFCVVGRRYGINKKYMVHTHTTRPLDSSKEEPITDTKITNIKKSLQSVLVEIVDFLVLFSSRFMSGE